MFTVSLVCVYTPIYNANIGCRRYFVPCNYLQLFKLFWL